MRPKLRNGPAAARVESRAASRSRRPEVKSPRSSRLGSRNVADSTGSTAGSTPVISSSSPPTGRSISSSSVESGSTTHSRPRARTRVPDSERAVGLTFQVSARPLGALTPCTDSPVTAGDALKRTSGVPGAWGPGER